MSESTEPASGPVMICMTSALKPPPTRIAKIGDSFVLPRSIPLVQAAAAIGGGLLGLLLFSFTLPLFGFSLFRFLLTIVIFGFLGVLISVWSPLKGESFATWIGLNIGRFKLKKPSINGLPVKAYIGIAPLESSASGPVKIVSGAVDVALGSVDDRGVVIPHNEAIENYVKNLKNNPI